jgi:type IV pilus assembly protein PilW
MQQNIRSALYHMGREIRMAGLDPTGKAGAGIIKAEADLIQFTEDIGGQDGTGQPDGNTSGTNENITYMLADGDGDGQVDDLVRESKGITRLIAENIKSLLFDYLDGTGSTTATLSAIRFVEITLRAAPDDGSSDRTVIARINCRNLGY